MSKMKELFMELDEAAEIIAKLIAESPTENRGDLFMMVANKLRAKNSQHYTASLFEQAAIEYGYEN